MSNETVYLTHEDPRFDYTPARKFGRLIKPIFPPGQIQLSPQVALYRARLILREIDGSDWIALVGDPIKIGICVAVAAERLGRLRLLKWNRHTLEYLPIEVDFRSTDIPSI